MVKQQLSYVSLFSSAGLGCYGLKLEQFECVATAELLPRRLEIQKANDVSSDSAGYVLGDLTEKCIQDRLLDRVSKWRENNQNAEVTVLIATPPCQGMSVANHKKKNELVRNSLVVESLRLIEQIRPKFFVLENVRSFLTSACIDADGKSKSIRDAIDDNLEAHYNIASRVVNLKDYGSPSSRTRTLVIGVRKDQRDISPWSVFPQAVAAPSLEALIGDLPRLTTMGQISADDIYHGFRRYDSRMRSWISNLEQGKSAFENTRPSERPHRYVEGIRVENKASNGDKYRRNVWARVAPCVHTRNDILASQSTVHPVDDRVFSIRELSLMMGVPTSFKWSPFGLDDLNALPLEEKEEYLREHELNIRQCLGEGVPTPVFQSIAGQIADYLRRKVSPHLISDADFVRAVEMANPRRKEDAAFYTRQDVAFQLVNRLPDFRKKKVLKILEPSVGAGAFLPALFEKYASHTIQLDVVDIDERAVENVKAMMERLKPGSRVSVRYINDDFLRMDAGAAKYDLIVGNPPFGRPKSSSNSPWASRLGCRDLFACFMEKALDMADHVAFIVPKVLLSAPEHAELRRHIAERKVSYIADFGESAFADIKIETIGIAMVTAPADVTRVVSNVTAKATWVRQEHLTDPVYPSWLIYRDEVFDEIAERLELGAFTAIRDRELSSKHYSPAGTVPVIRSKSLPRPGFVGDDPVYLATETLPASHRLYADRDDAIVVPNLSYYPRAIRLSPGVVVDGSAAVLLPRNGKPPTNRQIKFFSSQEFFYFYRIARNYSVRSLNVDSASVFFWGLLKSEALADFVEDFRSTSSDLFKTAAELFSEKDEDVSEDTQPKRLAAAQGG